MISNTELLVLGIMIVYTLIIVSGIHYYEARIKRTEEELVYWANAYDKAIQIKPASIAQHYTKLQLDNQDMRRSLYELDLDNTTLKRQLAQARQELLESRPLQNESSIYQKNIFENQRDFE